MLLIQLVLRPGEQIRAANRFSHGAAAEHVNYPYLCIILLTARWNSALPLFLLRLHKHPSWQRSRGGTLRRFVLPLPKKSRARSPVLRRCWPSSTLFCVLGVYGMETLAMLVGALVTPESSTLSTM